MSQILVRDLSPEVVEQLKQRAKSSRRSLQAEVKAILEESARTTEGARPIARRSREELVRLIAGIRERAGPQKTDSVEILRRIRDA